MRRVLFAVGMAAMMALLGCHSNPRTAGPPPSYMPQGAQAGSAASGPSVVVRGQVRNGVIPWTEDLTMVRALIAADYMGRSDPMSIYLHRGSKSIYVSPKRLLSGVYDPELNPGDVIEIRR